MGRMSARELASTAGAERPSLLVPTAVSDALAIAWRGLITYRRVPQLLVFSTIQPVVIAQRLPESLKVELTDVLLGLGDDPVARAHLDGGFVERFVPVSDASYDDVRSMLVACEEAGFLTLR